MTKSDIVMSVSKKSVEGRLNRFAPAGFKLIKVCPGVLGYRDRPTQNRELLHISCAGRTGHEEGEIWHSRGSEAEAEAVWKNEPSKIWRYGLSRR